MKIFFPPNQEYVFLSTLVLGIFLGILYDAFSVKRKLICDNAVVCFIDDCLFVSISGIMFLVCVFITNNGIIRWYEFFCCLTGFLLYKSTVSLVVMALMKRIVSVIHLILKLIFIYLIKLITPIVLITFIPFKILFKALKPIMQNILRCVFVLCIYRKSISMIKIGK